MRIAPERLFAVAALVMVGLPAWAVDLDATVKGVVYDPDGIEVPNAEVVIESNQGPRNVQTDDLGRYRFATLPPGDYKIKVLHPSFVPWESGVINVALGATLDIDVKLQNQGNPEVITVIASAPAVDTESVRSGAVLDADFLKNIPSGRDYQSAISSAPGIVDNGSGNPNARGGFDSSNQYYVDGVNVTDPVTNTFSMNMNYDAIESIEVLTGGMDAEYGRAMGAAVNIVTKSGSNDFEGQAMFTYSGSNTVVAPLLDGETAAGRDGSFQGVFNLGGPIVKDKAFFFASLQMDRGKSSLSVDPDEVPRDLERFPLQPYDFRSTYYFVKLTVQPTSTQRLWAHIQGDPTVIYNTEQDAYTLPSGETMQKQGGSILSIGHQWTPNDRTVVDSQVFLSSSNLDFNSILWKDCQERDDEGVCVDDFVGTDYLGEPVTQGWFGYDVGDFASGEYPYASFNKRRRLTAKSSLQRWFDLLGEHEAKVGVEAELMTSNTYSPGLDVGLPYFQRTNDGMDLTTYEPVYAEIYGYDQHEKLKGTVFSWFVQDVYKPIPRLSLRPGLRFDLPTLYNNQNEAVLGGLTIAPRLGGAFDLTGDGKTKVFAYYGRFYDSGYLGVASILNKTRGVTGGYNWSDDTQSFDLNDPLYESASTFLPGPDIRNPYSDEFDVGFSREIGDGLGFDVTFTREVARRFWEDDDVNLLWNDAGTDVIGSRDGTGQAQYRLRTPDDAFTKYTSAEFVVRKVFSDTWSMLASYTWSHAYGTNSADGATGLFDIPPQRKYEVGLLDYDIPHNLKITGSYTKPEAVHVGRVHMGYDLGWASSLQSGATYRHIVWNDYYQDYNNYDSVGDGRYRLPMLASTDLRGMLEFSAGDVDDPVASWGLGLDVFNVFNDREILDVDTRYDPKATGADQSFGDVLDRQSPRQYQVVIRGEF